jgi:osmotically-inducible protein OsmY
MLRPMLKVIYSFVLGVIVGALGFWYFVHGPGQGKIERAVDEATVGAGKLKQTIQHGLTNLSASEIQQEISRSGMVVREKARAAGTAIADSATNAKLTATIKGRLVTDLGKAGFDINVDTNDGLVTLSGTATSLDQIARAVKIALETEGVHKVISTVQWKAAKP